MVLSEAQQSAWNALYGAQCTPSFRIVAPGRVNIIGEHIDHQNYSVLPCAIEKSVQAIVHKTAAGKDTPALSIGHVDAKYEPVTFQTAEQVKLGAHKWYNYLIAAYLGTAEYFGSAKQDANEVGKAIEPQVGLGGELGISGKCAESPVNFSYKLMIFGDIPPAAGLSSSSALVVCSVYAFDCMKKTGDIPSLCANAERYVGTAGGGMDQAAICLSQAGQAQHIGFKPLTHESVQLPSEVTLVIANTCREAPKARDMAKMYNKRVFELKAACFLLIKKKNPDMAAKLTGDELIGTGLREVCRNVLKLGEAQMLEQLSTLMDDKVYTKQDIDDILGVQLRDHLLQKRCGVAVWEQNDSFYLYKRIRHVLTETLRVTTFVDLCNKHVKSGQPTPPAILTQLGSLLHGSQASLQDDFDCSCAEINELCAIATKAGALGARLTGAGWGGCTVSMVPNELVEKFLKAIEAQYYEPYLNGTKKVNPPLEHLPSKDRISDALFATVPGPAARKEAI